MHDGVGQNAPQEIEAQIRSPANLGTIRGCPPEDSRHVRQNIKRPLRYCRRQVRDLGKALQHEVSLGRREECGRQEEGSARFCESTALRGTGWKRNEKNSRQLVYPIA